jgi:pyruvate kinase
VSRSGIVCTIGPATCTAEALAAMRTAGMTVARLNGSHSDLDWHASAIALLRRTVPDLPILLDIPGRKIRTGALAAEPAFAAGDRIILTTDTSHDGSREVPVNYANLHEDLSPGNVILADDGTLRFTVEEIRGRSIVCRADCAGRLKSRKGINVPFVKLRTAMVTDRDRKMVDFAKCQGIDYIGISFVESGEHVDRIRALIEGSWPRIVSKVENQGGLDNLESVIAATDAVMIDRGDLSVETQLETIALDQKRVLDAARKHGKPVIVATEMLHTMIDNPFPTKAEVSDITNAVLDGCAATMLSGETAIGAHYLKAVETMRIVADRASAFLEEGQQPRGEARSVPQAMEDAVALICRDLPITKIVAVTISGYAARMISARRPRQPILAVSNDPMTARAMNLYYGTTGYHLDIPFSKTSLDHVAHCLKFLWQQRALAEEDLILVASVGYPRSGNRMNLIQTHAVADLAGTLGWTR